MDNDYTADIELFLVTCLIGDCYHVVEARRIAEHTETVHPGIGVDADVVTSTLWTCRDCGGIFERAYVKRHACRS